MRVFLMGATGFIGSYLVPELLGAGHHVVGLCRSDAGAEALRRAGAEVARGDVKDLAALRSLAGAAEGVIHAAFDHDAAATQSSEADRAVIEALGEALADSDRPLVITSGTGIARRASSGAPATERDPPVRSDEFPRAVSEEAADAVAARGGRVMVLRLPQVHDTRRQGRVTWHVQLAREKGRVAYVGAGDNRLAAVHVSDAVRLYRRVIEQGKAGARYHAVAEEGVPLRDVAAVIGAGLGVPVASIAPHEAADYFGWMARLATLDLAASSADTRAELSWTPRGPDLLSDLRAMDYGAC